MKFHLIKDKTTNRLFAVLTEEDGLFSATPVNGGREWCSWVASKDYDYNQIVDSLDPNLTVEGPLDPSADLIELIGRREEKSLSADRYYRWVNSHPLAPESKVLGRGIGNPRTRKLRNPAKKPDLSLDPDFDGISGEGTIYEGPVRKRFGRAVRRNAERGQRALEAADRPGKGKPNRLPIPKNPQALQIDTERVAKLRSELEKLQRAVGDGDLKPDQLEEAVAKFQELQDELASSPGVISRELDRVEKLANDVADRIEKRRKKRDRRNASRLGRWADRVRPEDSVDLDKLPPPAGPPAGSPPKPPSAEGTGRLARARRRFNERQAALIERVADVVRGNDSAEMASLPDRREGVPTPGAGRDWRKSASELLQRISRSGKKDVGPRNEHGYHGVTGVPVGNKGINDAEGAIKHLADGGDLIDVPDDFLSDAIVSQLDWDRNVPGIPKLPDKKPGGRFKWVNPSGAAQGGVNGMMIIEDQNTGQRFGLKFADGTMYGLDEDLHEVMGHHIAERLGYPLGAIRFAGTSRPDGGNGAQARPLRPDRPRRPIFVETAQELVDGIEPKRGGWQKKATEDELVTGRILDLLLGNEDRNGGNYFTVENEDGTFSFFPIDHGLGFGGYDVHSSMPPEATVAALKRAHELEYKSGIGSELDRRGKDNIGRQKIFDAVVKVQERLKTAQDEYDILDAMNDIFDQLGGDRGDEVSEHLAMLPDRLDLIINMDPQQLTNILTGK